MTVRDVDQGAKKLIADLKALGKLRVRVGVLADGPKKTAATDGGRAKGTRATLLEVAAVHEFGAPAAGIPQRSFIRATVDLRQAEIAKTQEALAAQVAAGAVAPRAALERLGAAVGGMIQARIAEGIGPALKPATIARKGSDKPLVDTGQLRSSVTWQVGDGGSQ